MTQTSNYEKFKLISNNRVKNKGLISSLKESITKIGYIMGKPVICNNRFEIIDGQHRFWACIELGLPIYYVIQSTNGVSSEDIMVDLNAKQRTWRLNEYINHYADRGVRFHKCVRDFETKYKLGISNSIAIVCDRDSKVSHKIRI